MYLDDYTNDLDHVISRAAEEGVGKIFLPSLKGEYVENMLRLERAYPQRFYPMIGLHPAYVKEDSDIELEIMRKWLLEHRFAAVGEIGLDYYWDTTYKTRQMDAFRYQLDLAVKHGLPVVIHSRSAMEDTLEILRDAVKKGGQGHFSLFFRHAGKCEGNHGFRVLPGQLAE